MTAPLPDRLLACPFCGEVPPPPTEIATNVWTIQCGSRLRHDAHATSWKSAEDAIAAWNTRAPAAALSGREAVMPDWDMAAHWIDRYAAGIDEYVQLDRVCAALGCQEPPDDWEPRATTRQPGDGVVVALPADELAELDKLVADVGPKQALSIFAELRAQLASKLDEADRSIAELKRRAAAPSAKGVANG